MRVHAATVVWDCHAGFAPFPDLDLDFLDRWRKAGASHVSVNVGFDVAMTWQDCLACAAHFRNWIETHGESFVLAERVNDIRRAKEMGKLAVSFDLEGADALNENIEMVSVYYQIGVRQMLFAFNRNNALGGGCMDEDIPLTPLGRKVVAEMNRVGMVIDCSHAGYTSSMDTMNLSNKPVIFSHSNPRALWEHPRNIRDDQIKACAATGGVVAINGVGIFLGNNDISADTILRNIDYVADLVGIDHVGIGLDAVLDPDEVGKLMAKYPNAWPSSSMKHAEPIAFAQPEVFPQLTAGLLERGYSEVEVRQVLGENLLRVATAVWR